MNSGVLFDLDGTLWDSVERLTPAWNRVLGEYGVEVTTPQLRALMGKTAEEFAAALLPGGADRPGGLRRHPVPPAAGDPGGPEARLEALYRQQLPGGVY